MSFAYPATEINGKYILKSGIQFVAEFKSLNESMAEKELIHKILIFNLWLSLKGGMGGWQREYTITRLRNFIYGCVCEAFEARDGERTQPQTSYIIFMVEFGRFARFLKARKHIPKSGIWFQCMCLRTVEAK